MHSVNSYCKAVHGDCLFFLPALRCPKEPPGALAKGSRSKGAPTCRRSIGSSRMTACLNARRKSHGSICDTVD
jgi:hypothetical protein